VSAARVHPTAEIESGVRLSEDVAIWSHVHIRGPDTEIGEETIVGEKSYIAYGVRIGRRVKINAFVYICTGVTIEDGVMVSAGVTFTNDKFPRATTPDLLHLRPSEPDEKTGSTKVLAGATIGAGAVIGSDLEVGRFAMIGMGSVVTRDVPDHHLVVGNPARSIGLVCKCGHLLLRLQEGDPQPSLPEIRCPTCGRRFAIAKGTMSELDSR
jgi:acetyltransferase-like isoleucine patch superfamily enzyme